MHLLLLVAAFLCCAAAGAVSAVSEASHNELRVLLFAIGAFLAAAGTVLQLLLRLAGSPRWTQFSVSLPLLAFHGATGVILVVALIHQDLDMTRVPYADVIIPALLVIDMVLLSISTALYPAPAPPKDAEQQLYHASLYESQLTLRKTPSDPQSVSKKVSEKTLVGPYSSRTALVLDLPDSPEVEDIIKRSIDHNMEHYNDATWMDSGAHNDANWMDSSAHLHSLSNSESDENGPRTRRGTGLGLFAPGRLSTDSFKRPSVRAHELKGSKSVPSLWRGNTSTVTSPRTPTSAFESVLTLHSEKPLAYSSIKEDQEFSFKASYGRRNLAPLSVVLPQGPDNGLSEVPTGGRRVSIVHVNCEEGPSNAVKRSKSTGVLGHKKIKKEQRWKSINDEKVFLQSVNPLLLPPVLRTGVSPIMELKRQQLESVEREKRRESEPAIPSTPRITEIHQSPKNTAFTRPLSPSMAQIPTHSEEIQSFSQPFIYKAPNDTPVPEGPRKFPFLSPVGEDDAIETPESHLNEAPEELDDSDELHLPYADEFGTLQPEEDLNFADFDQDTALVRDEPRKKKGIYNFDVIYEKQAQHKQPVVYGETLDGLEKMAQSRPVWNVLEISSPSLPVNHISLHDWDQNQQTWQEHRVRSGVNLNIPGITRLVSDGNLQGAFLVPSQDNRSDNIDALSDFHSFGENDETRRPLCSLLARSYSAPSLHTFRKLLVQSSIPLEVPEPIQLTHYITPTNERPVSTNLLPIRKFFRMEHSPKRLGSMFRKRDTRSSTDYSHKHSGSVILVAFSVGLASSRSNLPKKALRLLLTRQSTSNSAKQPLAVPRSAVHSHNASLTIPQIDALDFWDLETGPSSDRSRVSSVPSAVIGEYDREKWRTLKALQNQDRLLA